MGKDISKLSESEAMFYAEGSAACRNYSCLTMKVRTLSQHVLIGILIALSVAAVGNEQFFFEKALWPIFYFGGIILGLFSISLALVDWHYQSAFTAIRNVLVTIEGNEFGPWHAHKKIRSKMGHDFVSSYFPFWVLWFIGVVAFLVGYDNHFGDRPWLLVIGLFFALEELSIFIYIYFSEREKKET